MSDDPQANADLVTRVDHAMGRHDVDHDFRDEILVGINRAGGLGEVSWEELPRPIQEMIEEVEALPQTGWDDPADVPEGAEDKF